MCRGHVHLWCRNSETVMALFASHPVQGLAMQFQGLSIVTSVSSHVTRFIPGSIDISLQGLEDESRDRAVTRSKDSKKGKKTITKTTTDEPRHDWRKTVLLVLLSRRVYTLIYPLSHMLLWLLSPLCPLGPCLGCAICRITSGKAQR